MEMLEGAVIGATRINGGADFVMIINLIAIGISFVSLAVAIWALLHSYGQARQSKISTFYDHLSRARADETKDNGIGYLKSLVQKYDTEYVDELWDKLYFEKKKKHPDQPFSQTHLKNDTM